MTLCELYTSKAIERATKDEIAKANIDVIRLLLVAQEHRANQLAAMCLHFLATNYEIMTKRPEFHQLTGSNLEYIEANQWPPRSFYERLARYEQSLKGAPVQKCIVM